MRKAITFLTFFALFLIALIFVPLELFPGNLLKNISQIPAQYKPFLMVFLNSLTYSLIVWLILTVLSRRIGKE